MAQPHNEFDEIDFPVAIGVAALGQNASVIDATRLEGFEMGPTESHDIVESVEFMAEQEFTPRHLRRALASLHLTDLA